MKPAIDALEARDLAEPARKIARACGLDLEAMFTDRQRPAPQARAEFYAHLMGLGWSIAAVARFVGKDRKCVATALANRPQAEPEAAQ